jgi:hypothetical protein
LNEETCQWISPVAMPIDDKMYRWDEPTMSWIEVGVTTATAGFNALAPSQTGNNGKYLSTDGTNTSWGALSVTPTAVSDQLNSSTGYFDLPAGTTAAKTG